MSYNLNPLHTVQCRVPVTEINNERFYAILRGGAQVTYKPFTTNSISTSSIQFTCPPPNPNIIVDRSLQMNLPVRMVFNVATPNANVVYRSGYDAPRFMPVSSAINTLQVNLNNTAVSINMSDVIHALLRYNTTQKLKGHKYSTSPSCPDQSQNYSDLQGAIRNPLASYGDSNDENVLGRGGFLYQIVANTTSQLVIDAVFTENLFISPFDWGCSEVGGFIGLQTMDFNITFVGNPANRMWSHDNSGVNAPGVITSSAVAFNNFSSIYNAPFSYDAGLAVPQLLFRYITPNELQAIPRSVCYPYFTVDRYPYDFNSTIAANQAGTIVSNNIQLKSIPRRIYIYARNSNSVLQSSPIYTDTYLGITGIRLNWNNYSGLLSNATAYDLYSMSVKNHCNMSWEQWSGGPVYQTGSASNQIGTVGSVLCISMAEDVGLSDTEAPGLLGTYQLQLEIDVINTNQTNSITPTLYIVVVSEGTFTIENNRSVSQIGVISKMDILEAKQHQSPFIDYHDIMKVNGGNFLSGVKRFGQNIWKNVKPYVRSAVKLGKKIYPYAKAAYNTARAVAPLLIGLGEGGSMAGNGSYTGGELVGGQQEDYQMLRSSHPMHGSRQMPQDGGRMVSRKHLEQRLQRM